MRNTLSLLVLMAILAIVVAAYAPTFTVSTGNGTLTVTVTTTGASKTGGTLSGIHNPSAAALPAATPPAMQIPVNWGKISSGVMPPAYNHK